ncbi:hypothetical protein [Actinomycetospora aeridis]|uniref:Uncharacterized protein n=1 Tax=Actinomycetospora aeridis TaxID=3129231 RepID=A0ABU8N2C0_9PSEU
MSWPDAVPGQPDDHTREARSDYERYLWEARRYSPPPVDPRWNDQGPTAMAMASPRRRAQYLDPIADREVGAA